ncbi:disulfide reductase [Methanococcoides methylutens]|uniref:CoB--CoM heterodisulfide reductase 2 subunit E n=1 Tax=Methanococcoides methylutens MM1 TaxID=1434104 RepID=A0A0E3SPW2_METMT|nr:disulfide reductase [Methanococcoides methylutens]AKB84631.1 CoB--CoM heterodisulfide reductase 2 subunit E [Methanococcoides methylutens MM1]
MSMEYFSGLSETAEIANSFGMLTESMKITFAAVMIMATISIAIFMLGMYINLKKWGMGSEGYSLKPKGSIFTFPKALAYQMSAKGHGHGQNIFVTLILDALLQRRALRRSPGRWIMHIAIFGGWIALCIMSVAMFVVEIIHMVGIHIISPEVFREMLSFPNDVFSYILLFGIIVAIFRRLFLKKARESTIAFDSVLLIGLTIIVITGFVADGLRNGNFWGFGMQSDLAPPAALFHVVISLFFCIAYIPFSKYMHMIAGPLTLLANKGGE